tara:strand:- start:536 stop:1048 length:513 start_codon:yes stop_codon:yes gene_type:complete
MAITIDGDGTITGLSVGGLPDGVVDADMLAANAVTTAKISDSQITTAKISDSQVTNAKLASSGGLAKAWVNFEASGTVGIINNFNVSSITDGGEGVFTVNFTNALDSANYTMTGGAHSFSTDFTGIVVSLDARSGGGSSITTKTTSACAIVTAAGTTNTDPVNVSVVFFE